MSTESNLLEQLTLHQRKILNPIGAGKSTQEIAEKLFIIVKTVETHRKHLMNRLNIHEVAGLVHYAIRIKLVLLAE